MLKNLLRRFSIDIAIDLGTSNTRVYVKDRGIIAREATVVAFHKKTKQLMAIGTPAKQMMGKTPPNIITSSPLRHGVISDVDRVNDLLREMMRRAMMGQQKVNLQLSRPRVLINIPAKVTEVERKAVRDVCARAGAGEVILIENPTAAAIGAGLHIDKPVGSAIMNLGGGITEIAIISLGGIVSSVTTKVAGDYFDQLIMAYVKQVYNIVIGEKTAEDIKINIGSAVTTKTADTKGFTVRGRDVRSGLPKTVEIFSDDVAIAIKPALEDIGRMVKDIIDAAPPEVVSDVLAEGVMLTGGQAQLSLIQSWMQEYTKIPIHVADDPATCVVRGAAKTLQDTNLASSIKI